MSEWSEHRGVHARYYGDGVSALAWDEGGWRLDYCGASTSGPEDLPFSRALCDEAAVVYALIALARKAAAWAEGIDAELARRYRAAHLAMDAWEFDDVRRTTATEHEVDALFAAVTATHAALVRGYL